MIIQLIVALLLPWAIGTVVVLMLLKRKSGALLLASGMGYLLGLLLVSCLMWGYHVIGRAFDIQSFLLIMFLLFGMLSLVLFRHYALSPILQKQLVQKHCFVNLTWLVGLCLVILMGYRLGLTFVDLTVKPVFPWDGWSHWSAKAKIFYYHQGFPSLYDTSMPFWQIDDNNVGLVNGASRHPYFVSLVQTYAALAWGTWHDGVVNLPWLQCGIAIGLTIIGGLRYMGVAWLPALLTGYMVLSLPILDTHLSLGSYADIWVAYGYLFTGIALAIALTEKNRGLGMLCLLAVVAIYHVKHTALFLLLPAVFSACLYFIAGRSKFILFYLILLGCLPILYWNIDVIQTTVGELFGTTWIRLFWLNTSAIHLWDELILKDNWHFLFLLSLISFSLLLFTKQRKTDSSILVNIVTIVLLLTILSAILFTNKMANENFTGYVNRVLLQIAPLLCLMPPLYFFSGDRKSV